MVKRRLVPRAPSPSSASISAAMRGNKREGTRPELVVRRALTELGLRYRLHAAALPGKPDIVFHAQRIVIFVHGCFWHQHANANCPLRTTPRSNRTYWNAKLRRNVLRDHSTKRALRRLGWKVVTIWECQTHLAKGIARRVMKPRQAPRAVESANHKSVVRRRPVVL